MRIIRKLYGGIDLTWPRLIIAAAAIGLIVGGIMLIPVSDQSSLKDIGTNFEWWIFFGTLIVANSKNPVDSAAKAFVFFLISQPLIYLVQVPFSSLGWGLFGYYKYWFLWTLATIPMGAVGHFVRRGDMISAFILTPMNVFLAFHMVGYARSALTDPPNHLASAIFCAVFIVLPILGIAKTVPARAVAWSAAVTAVAVIAILSIVSGGKDYSPTINCRENGIEFTADSEIVASVNITEEHVTEFEGDYYLNLIICRDEAKITIETNGVEKTYKLTFNEETQVFDVTEE